ncbi:hypothetical protein QKQ25_gp057 [Hyphantria cunea granulovirus]|uniref:Uncharacterized protein n=1 Tax=Hyphantria cunea granulovirus TaxID=307448 RepID=A0AAF1D277_9BBAC|nr:hypothetical protein QKQ25_gp057 [Hyphantria cunea granulovirus]QBQ01610.1 hypothetical protein HycuGV_00057 [Hyphantria cunea granulovirus]
MTFFTFDLFITRFVYIIPQIFAPFDKNLCTHFSTFMCTYFIIGLILQIKKFLN